MRLLHRDRTDHDTSTDDDTRADDTTVDGSRTEAVRVAPATDDPTVVHRPDDTVVADGTHRVERADRVERPVVADGDASPMATTVRERTWTFAPGQVVSFAAGVATLAVGVIALLRAGVDASLAQPTVHILGYSHTAWLGLAEIGLGLLLVLAGSGAWGRPLSVLLGAATLVAGVLVLAEPGQMPSQLGIEKAFGWPLIALGAIVALAAMALPVWRRRTITTD